MDCMLTRCGLEDDQLVIEATQRLVENVPMKILVIEDEVRLAEYLKKEHLRHLGYKLLDRADTLVNENVPVLDLHFYFAVRGGFYYRWRDHDPFGLDEAVTSFQRQIGLGANVVRFFREDKNWGFIPAHAGYRQLRIIEEKRGNWTLARALCKQAKAEGWADDWDHHIGRIDKKLAAMKTQG